ncbi:MAG: maltose alpha-D-glucosyltransferase [Woeseia sp.]
MAVERTEGQGDPLWYKDAVIYQVHVRSFFDFNNDGIGDFEGLLQKLDYIHNLGVTAIWLLPFYPSPGRDDGYDIADYRNINPVYGTRRHFRAFVREAHRRDLKVITELVVNHTSDQHPWFQAARRAKPGSAKRDFYVWSDTDQTFAGTRIIFTDTEESNWAWDPVAKQYYWHRFFSHQPDLNLNNPKVVQAVIQVMRFWFAMGVDGMRLDAIPYLCVREGTSNENLPETHEVIRQIRRAVDSEFPNRMLLAEANQWPEDVREYFGEGDECHAAYHFPLMPRMYMALAQEDRHPVVEIMQQTPDIPDTCQWAVFLRNHDELTLEMVTDSERDYMYQTYATDPRMRVNIGIRRRLAPLMDNDMAKVQLMNSLLLSMPGSPIVYYGDELGMGDNFYLGDRNGVRTPMQWSPDRNGGFSRADPQSLFLPPIMDPIYGYQAVNVEAQVREPASLLNWTQRILNVRKAHKAFGRGSLKFLRPGNRKILAYVREYNGDVLLCVANLARSAQPVELNLSRFEGRVPVELMGHTPFPPIGELPYLLTLPGHGFYWFELAEGAEIPSWHEDHVLSEELPWLVLVDGLSSFTRAAGTGDTPVARLIRGFETQAVPTYLAHQRWFAAKDEAIESSALADASVWRTQRNSWLLAFVDVHLAKSGTQRYLLPLALEWERDESPPAVAPLRMAYVRQRADTGLLYDAFAKGSFYLDLLDAFRAQESLEWGEGRLQFIPTGAFESLAGGEIEQQTVRRTSTEGSNSTFLIDDRLFLKAYRRLQEGINPEWEMGRHLTDASPCDCVAAVAGAVEYRPAAGEPSTLMLLQAAVRNQGDGWSYTMQYLVRHLDISLARSPEAPPEEHEHATYLMHMGTLARRTADLHRALAVETGDPAFDPEPLDSSRVAQWQEQVRREARQTLQLLGERREQLPDPLPQQIEKLAAEEERLYRLVDSLAPDSVDAICTRYHGDYHLGQVLLVENDFIITDLEGEPARSFAERRRKHTVLKDVGGMLRSLKYARNVAERELAQSRPVDVERGAVLLEEWLREAETAFLDAYRDAIRGCPVYPAREADAEALIGLASLEKLLYEVRYELANRPAWLPGPLDDLSRQVREQ